MGEKIIDFDQYIRQGEPAVSERAKYWVAAMGMQQVDGLTPSRYLKELVAKNIEGDISLEEIRHLIKQYYDSKQNRTEEEMETLEPDKVSINIAEILAENTFSFNPLELVSIHKRIFDGVFDFAGKVRDYNISKSEWILGGMSVYYSSADMIMTTLEYDFKEEKKVNYFKLSEKQQIRQLAQFISSIWQVHAFGEGNTRTVAVFMLKYLRKLGFNAEITLYKDNSWFFRNALVRASYENISENIIPTTKFVENFIQNLSFGGNLSLKNRETHINWELVQKELQDEGVLLVANDDITESIDVGIKQRNVGIKQRNVGINSKILEIIKENPTTSASELAEKLEKSDRTIERHIEKLKNDGILLRVGSRKTGHWEVLNG